MSYLFVPLEVPLGRTQVFVDILEEVAGLVFFTLQLGAAVKVDIVLPAVPETPPLDDQIVCRSREPPKCKSFYLVWFWLGKRGSNGVDQNFLSLNCSSFLFWISVKRLVSLGAMSTRNFLKTLAKLTPNRERQSTIDSKTKWSYTHNSGCRP